MSADEGAVPVSVDDVQTRVSRDARREGESREFVLDVLVDGSPVRRSARVAYSEAHLRVDDQQVALDSVFWVSRRAGLVLLFARRVTIAVLGKGGDLEELARAVERGSDRAAQRSLLQPLTREVVVCTAGTAVSGSIGDTRVSGLHLAVFTQQGLHLFAGSRSHSLEWPVSRVGELGSAPGERGRSGLRLTSEQVSLTLRYLFPEEIQAVARVATRAPERAPEPERSLEMFAKGEVAPPPPARLPEFAVSSEVLTEACETAARRVRVDPTLDRRFGDGFFDRHFQDLGEIALGPLMLRKSAAAGASSLARAVEALDADRLREDAVAAFRGAGDHLFEVYGGEIERLVAERRIDREATEAIRSSVADRDHVDGSLDSVVRVLDPTFERVLARQHLLLQRLQAYEHAPPDTDETGVEEAADEWRCDLLALDRAYGAAWSEVLEEMAEMWSERFLPRFVRLSAIPRRRLSEGARLAILATVTFFVVAAIAVWLW